MGILEFINALRETDKYIGDIYINGGCYQFSKLLCKMYKGAKTLVSLSKETGYHAVTEYKNVLYDIDGIVNDSLKYKTPNKKEIKIMENWSFSKNYLIKIGECPNCETPFFVKSNQIIIGDN